MLREEVKLLLQRGDMDILVTLMLGGENFPWTNMGGKVVLNTNQETVEGFPSWMIDWKRELYWVFEAEDVWGDYVILSPEEYEEATKIAEAIGREDVICA